MTWSDIFHYAAIGNPVSKAVIGTTASVLRLNGPKYSAPVVTTDNLTSVMPPLWRLAGRHYYFMRLAGLSGASAVVLGAIGSHKIHNLEDKGEAKAIFETANRFHFFHSIAMMGLPIAKYPVLTGSLMITGTLLFSGLLYYRALTGNKQYSKFAPWGGTCLILAWISLLL